MKVGQQALTIKPVLLMEGAHATGGALARGVGIRGGQREGRFNEEAQKLLLA